LGLSFKGCIRDEPSWCSKTQVVQIVTVELDTGSSQGSQALTLLITLGLQIIVKEEQGKESLDPLLG
jgi:hypothetical protein